MSGVSQFQGYISPFLEPPADPVKYPVFQIVPITGPNTVKPAVVSLPLCRIKKAEKAIGVKFANLCCFGVEMAVKWPMMTPKSIQKGNFLGALHKNSTDIWGDGFILDIKAT